MDNRNTEDWRTNATLPMPVMQPTSPNPSTTIHDTIPVVAMPSYTNPVKVEEQIVLPVEKPASPTLRERLASTVAMPVIKLKPGKESTGAVGSEPQNKRSPLTKYIDSDADTKLMPVIQPLAAQHSWSKALTTDLPLIVVLMLVGFVAVGFNNLNFPAYNRFDDEGIYVQQAWSVLRQGQLAPYSYFYDHAPAGWVLLAGWFGLTGGPLTFGNAFDSGRLFILVLHLAMIPMLFQIARKLGCNIGMATLATLLFSISPMAIVYERLILLDNIMLFWVLLSLNLILDGRGRLSRVVLSGLCFGIAILTKETAAFLVPAMLFIAWQQRWKHQGRFALLSWVGPMLLVLSIYPLYALIKGELLPAGYSLGFFIFNAETSPDKISLIDALKWQASRGGEGQFLKLVTSEWLLRDPILFAGGGLASALNILRIFKRNRQAFAAGMLGLLPLYYLARGGLVFDFYVIFAIPFLCVNIALLLTALLKRLPTLAGGGVAVLLTGMLLGGYWGANTLEPLFQDNPAQVDREATSWIKQNVPAQSMIVTRNDMWTDLHENGLGGPVFPNAHSHWKVALDPAIRSGVFHDDWHSIDYIIVTPDLKKDLNDTKATMVLEALSNAYLIKHWEASGDVIELWKVNNGKPGQNSEAKALLPESAEYIKQNFARNGFYASPDGTVTAESQANALLRDVWTNNKEDFEETWKWTQTHLIGQNGLLAWQWKDGQILDHQSSSVADTNAALALLLGSKRWNDSTLLEKGRNLVRVSWQAETVLIGDQPLMVAGDWATRGPVVVFNPGYFSPYAYRIFEEVDPEHDWKGLIDTGYKTLFAATSDKLGLTKSAGLPPDWVGVEQATGKIVPVKLSQGDSTLYSAEAARTYWRVALDLSWSNDGRAKTFLEQAGFLRDEVARKGSVSAVYAHDGQLVQKASDQVSTSGTLAALLTLEPLTANRFYDSQVWGNIDHSVQGVYWGKPKDLYSQEWGWFGTALYADALPNLWKSH